MKKWLLSALACAMLMILAACSFGGSAQETISPAASASSAATVFTSPIFTAFVTPTALITVTPTFAPTVSPTPTGTAIPTGIPTGTPFVTPTGTPTASPTQKPTPRPTTNPTASPVPTATPVPLSDDIQKILDSMTLTEKIGQLFFVRPEALQSGTVSAVSEKTRQNAGTYPVGGVVLFKNNVVSPSQLTKFTADLKTLSRIPTIVAIDEEGGTVARIANNSAFSVKKYTNMASVGKTKDPEKAREVGLTIGAYLKKYGISLDFAPVVDVDTASNSVIGKRSFGSDPALVASMAAREIDGLHENGVLTCIKHYPGHGDTKEDTHTGMVTLPKDWATLQTCELIPFVQTLGKTDCVMAAHITLPAVDSSGLPASLSPVLINEKLRGELGFTGVVITDALEMGAVTKYYSSAEAAVLAILAGCDVVLMPADLPAAFAGIETAVADGRISMERLNESVARILAMKQKAGLL